MTRLLNYHVLTWPEIKALPRNTPLIIPLGKNHPQDNLFQHLSSASVICLLPAIPYGWEGSGLAVSKGFLSTFSTNLLDSLADDGFSRVYSFSPHGIDLDL